MLSAEGCQDPLIPAGVAEVTRADAALLPTKELPTAPVYVRHPDGTLARATAPGHKEEGAEIEENEVPRPTSRLAATARALRVAVSRSIANQTVENAVRRKELLRKLLITEVVVDICIGIVCEIYGWRPSFHLSSPTWRILSYCLPSLWWVYAAAYFSFGFATLGGVRDRLYGWLSTLALVSALVELIVALTLVHRMFAKNSVGAILGPVVVLVDLPLRLGVSLQSKILSEDLKQLLLLPPDII